MTRFFIMTAQRAAFLRGAFDGEQQLNPRRITAGEHAGKYALPERVKSDPAFFDVADNLEGVPVVEIDVAEAWPETD